MNHVHRWRIGEPGGPLSEGTCPCGEVRLFGNSEDAAEELHRGRTGGNWQEMAMERRNRIQQMVMR